LFHAIIYRDIIYDFISQYHHPPQSTAIYRDFKKSTAISKGYNVGLRYINIYSILYSTSSCSDLNTISHIRKALYKFLSHSEPEFLNFEEAQESIPGIQFRQAV